MYHDSMKLKRLMELNKKAEYERHFTFSEFHEITIKHLLDSEGIKNCEVFDGYENALRVVVRFGDANDVTYEEPYPISIIKVTPSSTKFTTFEHRDILGTLMGLGIIVPWGRFLWYRVSTRYHKNRPRGTILSS